MKDIKTDLINFIIAQPAGKILNLSQISRESGISKPSIGKWIPILIARGDIDNIITTQKSGNTILIIRKWYL